MKRSDSDQLLREILDDGDAANFRATSLAGGLELLRQRQRRRRLARACATFVAPSMLVFVLVFHQITKPLPKAAPPRPALAQLSAPDKVKIITDDELFALFPGRAMALIGTPGSQRLVFLDHGRASEQP